ncbi:MAG: right-handed parallel beta-helix repeat-containing protein [Planctomycetota bacterium]
MKTHRNVMSVICFVLLVCVCSLYAAEYTVNPGESIQAAIAAAGDGDTVTVMPGTYVENLNLLGKAITLTSTEPTDPAIVEATILDGRQRDSVITCDSGEGPDTLITGFTITNGNAFRGGGMYNSGTTPTVTHCTFIGNGAYGLGAGMYNDGSRSNIRMKVSDCVFKDNVMDMPNANLWGGGMYNYYAEVAITNCTFEGNRIGTKDRFGHTSALGAGMFNHFSIVTVTDCIFRNNTTINGDGGGMLGVSSELKVSGCEFSNNMASRLGGGIFIFDMGSRTEQSTIVNCTFVGNAAGDESDTRSFEGGLGGGVGVYSLRKLHITNCIFTDNTAYSGARSESYGGGFYDYANATTLSGCTFNGNAADYGGAVYGGSIANSILWGNTAAVEGSEVYEVKSVDFCNVQGGYAGDGNIDLDPLFADDDLGLTSDSPCIDAGSNDLIGRDWADLDGDGITEDETVPYDLDYNLRIENDIVDMGAYEFAAPAIPVAVDIKPQSCPNPVNVKSKGVFDVAVLGTDIFDVRDIDIATVSLEGVAPLLSRYKDETGPVIDGQECECQSKKKDGVVDLTMKFGTEQITAALGEVEDGQEWLLHLTGQLNDGTTIEGTDCILIKRKGK